MTISGTLLRSMICATVLAGVCCLHQPAQAGSVESVRITFTEPAYAGLPVWVYVDPAKGVAGLAPIRYPFTGSPRDFGLYKFEVKRGEESLKITYGDRAHSGPPDGSAAPASSPTGRLPLHLVCDLSQPGTYEVRLTVTGAGRADFDKIVAASEWTRLELKPSTSTQRSEYRDKLIKNPPTDPGKIIGDFLPSLLAVPDSRSLAVLCNYFKHQDDLIQAYSVNGLSYFGAADVQKAVIDYIKTNGPTERLAYYLSWYQKTFEPRSVELAEALMGQLKSNSPDVIGATVHALGFMRAYDWKSHPEMPERMANAVWEAVPHIRAVGGRQALWPLALYAGGVKSEKSREILLDLLPEESVREQALICLCWIGDPRDLPMLGESLKSGTGSIAYQLVKTYGDKAIPYLQAALKDSTVPRVRLECARELMRMHQPEAYYFFKDALEANRSYKQQAIQFLRDDLANDQKADEKELLAYLQKALDALPGKDPVKSGSDANQSKGDRFR